MSEFDLVIGQGPVHFIGIGGISMSGLAHILISRGIKVTGSDQADSFSVEKLRNLGAEIVIPHSARVIGGQSLVVYTAAISENNEELKEARRQKIKTMERGRFLGQLAKVYSNTFAVSGTHGKTTSTGMLASIMLAADKNPTIHIGGEMPAIGGNTRIGGTEYFLMEACEYKNSFHGFFPTSSLILNIEADHLDFFKDISAVVASFLTYCANVSQEGTIVLNADDAGCRDLASKLGRKFTAYTLDEAYSPVNPSYENFDPATVYCAESLIFNQGCGEFDVVRNGEFIEKVRLNVPGTHNVYNALGCFALSHLAGFHASDISNGLQQFTGTGRRFEQKNNLKGICLIDDYAHHPTELIATLTTTRLLSQGRILCIFQPHTYTRTKALFSDFVSVLTKADLVVLVDIYAAREPDLGQIHSRDLALAINDAGGHAKYAASFDEAAHLVLIEYHEGDCILTLGAGDVNLAGEIILNATIQSAPAR